MQEETIPTSELINRDISMTEFVAFMIKHQEKFKRFLKTEITKVEDKSVVGDTMEETYRYHCFVAGQKQTLEEIINYFEHEKYLTSTNPKTIKAFQD